MLERLPTHVVFDAAKSDRPRAKLHLFDWLPCVAGARRNEVAAAARASGARFAAAARAFGAR